VARKRRITTPIAAARTVLKWAEALTPRRFTQVKSAKNATAQTAYGTDGMKCVVTMLHHRMQIIGLSM
jgi:hypothetical protein